MNQVNNDESLSAIDEALARTARDIKTVVEGLANLLIRKNAAYGDSALNPLRIFSSAPADEQIKVRLDDKLNRIRNTTLRGEQDDDFAEDVIKDLMGYLVLLRVSHDRKSRADGMTCNTAAPAPRDFLKDIGANNINKFIEELGEKERQLVEENTRLKNILGMNRAVGNTRPDVMPGIDRHSS